jgi:hypothetical protein
MSNTTNLVSVSIPASQQQEIHDVINKLRQLLSFTVSLNAIDADALLYPGARGMEGCRAMVAAIDRFPDRFPAGVCDPTEMHTDLALFDLIKGLIPQLQGLLDSLDITQKAAASDLFRASLQSYDIAKAVASATPGLEAAIDPMKAVLDRHSRK